MSTAPRPRPVVALLGAIPNGLASSIDGLLAEHGVETAPVQAGVSTGPEIVAMLPVAVISWTCDPFAVVSTMMIRGVPEIADTQVIALAPTASRAEFVEAFATGADDLVGVDRVDGIVPRVKNAMAAREAPKRSRGSVLVASADDRWALLAMKAFARGGYDVVAVRERDHVLRGAMEARARVVVAGPDFSADDSLLERSRESQLAWVLTSPTIPSTISRERVKRVDATLPAEALVYGTNELLFSVGANQRASVRLPFATTISFCVGGSTRDEIGFCHNISAGGMYVRTLAPLSRGDEAWIEMCAPGEERVLRLVGDVQWAKKQGRDDASAPLGFGVKLTGGLGADLDRYRAAYEVLLRDTMCDPGPLSVNTTTGTDDFERVNALTLRASSLAQIARSVGWCIRCIEDAHAEDSPVAPVHPHDGAREAARSERAQRE